MDTLFSSSSKICPPKSMNLCRHNSVKRRVHLVCIMRVPYFKFYAFFASHWLVFELISKILKWFWNLKPSSWTPCPTFCQKTLNSVSEETKRRDGTCRDDWRPPLFKYKFRLKIRSSIARLFIFSSYFFSLQRQIAPHGALRKNPKNLMQFRFRNIFS